MVDAVAVADADADDSYMQLDKFTIPICTYLMGRWRIKIVYKICNCVTGIE